MIQLRCDTIASICDGTLYNTQAAMRLIAGVTIDSRSVTDGALFVAIRGEHNDGHDYIEAAIGSGAGGLLVEHDYPITELLPGFIPVITVQDSHEALIKLAKAYRDKVAPRCYAITGSNGKTTTKEYVYQMLQAVNENSYRSPGNLNNLYGVPLSVLAMPSQTEEAVFELGISTKNEMPALSRLVHPDVIIITNVGPSHLAYLDSVEDVARTKMELVYNAPDHTKVIVNADDPILMAEAQKTGRSLITFGIKQKADWTPANVTHDELGDTLVTIDQDRFKLPLPGDHQILNILSAYAACREAGYSFSGKAEDIYFETAPLRGQKMIYEGITFVADCYNANPASMKASLETFFAIENNKRRCLVLGDMLELGADEVRYHRELGRLVAAYAPDICIMVGSLSKASVDEALLSGMSANTIFWFKSVEEAIPVFTNLVREDDVVFIKGSRGMRLEQILKPYSGEGTH